MIINLNHLSSYHQLYYSYLVLIIKGKLRLIALNETLTLTFPRISIFDLVKDLSVFLRIL